MRLFDKSPPPRPGTTTSGAPAMGSAADGIPGHFADQFPAIWPVRAGRPRDHRHVRVQQRIRNLRDRPHPPRRPGFDAETPDGGILTHKPYQISLQLADGPTVASGRSHGDSEPTKPIL